MSKNEIIFEQLEIDFSIEKEAIIKIDNKQNTEGKKKKSKKTAINKNNDKSNSNETFKNQEITNENEEYIIKNEDNIQKETLETRDTSEGKHEVKQEIHLVESKPTINDNKSFLHAVNKLNQEKFEQSKKEELQLNKDFPYIACPIMTNAEIQLYHFMKENLLLKERIEIFPKVRLGDIVQLDERISKNQKDYYKIACKHVDYVIVDKNTLEIICAVELDDYTHEKESVKERDIFVYHVLQTVGIKLERIKTKIAIIEKSDLYNIETTITEYFRPKCSWCGADTVVKTLNKHGNRHRFYSCSHFPDCRWSLDCDS